MYKGIGLYDHFIMGQDSEDYSPIKYEDCEGRIVNVASIKPRKTKFTPRSYYNCEFCGKWYRSKTSLGLHRRLECGKEPTFQCPYCPLKTHQKGNLQVHIKKKHLDQVLNESFNPNRSRTSDTFNESSSDFDDSILSPSEHKHHPNQGLHSMLMDSSSLLQTLGSKSVPPSAGQAKSKPVLVVPKSFSVHSVDKTNENNPLFPKAPEINQNLSVSFTDNYSKIISGPGQTKVNQKPMKVHDENNTKLLETAKKIEAINSFGSIRVEPVAQSQQKLKPTNSSNLNSAQTNSGVEKSVFVHKMGLLSVDSVTPKHHGIVKAVTVMPPVEKPQPQKSNISTKNSLISELLSSPQLTEKLVPCLPDNSKANNIPGNSTESEKPLQRNSTTCKIGVKDLKLLTNAESEPVSTSIKEKTEIKQTTE